jgi:transposase
MERLTMSKTREILRTRWALGLSVREASRATGASTGVVSKTASRAQKAGLTWEAVDALSEVELERRLYGEPVPVQSDRAEPDPVWMHRELRRKGVTLELLHLEYLGEHPTGFRYTAFCDRYRGWLSRQSVVMRQVHRAGEKCFVDYSGLRLHIVDPVTSERIAVELFVAVLGASSLTFAIATLTQQVPDFVRGHVKAFEYFGGSAKITVSDQLRSAVIAPSRYEPTIHRTYIDLGRHYDTAIVPARPGKPRDKAKVEVAVQVAQRWIAARLRNETFFSIEALNARIAELLEDLNNRPMKRLGVSRRELFERCERQALRPLPSEAYVVSEWQRDKLDPSYHVRVDEHVYSAPHALVGEVVETRMTPSTVEVFHRGERVAAHVRSHEAGKTTAPEHMTASHRAHCDAEADVIAWSSSVGPMCLAMVERILNANPVREAAVRSTQGLRSVARKYGDARTERACETALRLGAQSYKPVERMLKLGREAMPLHGDEPTQRAPIAHGNVRGPGYFH